MKKKFACVAAVVLAIFVSAASVQGASAGSIFVIALDSSDVGGSGWFAGYVVYGQSGTYTLMISANGNENSFPVTNIKVIVLVSNEAENGGLASLSIEGTLITTFTHGAPAYYGPNGGPFSEPDYYGYNDQYVIPTLTYSEGHWPESAKEVTVTVSFSSDATANSKVMFLCYGTDAKGQELKTAFSNGTLFVLPEYPLPFLAVGGFFGAYAVFKKLKR